jgi:hypothetical protein
MKGLNCTKQDERSKAIQEYATKSNKMSLTERNQPSYSWIALLRSFSYMQFNSFVSGIFHSIDYKLHTRLRAMTGTGISSLPKLFHSRASYSPIPNDSG